MALLACEWFLRQQGRVFPSSLMTASEVGVHSEARANLTK